MRWTSRNVKILSIQTDANAGCLDPTSNRYLKEMKVKNKEKRKQEVDNQRAENEERGIRARGCISYRNCFCFNSSTQVVTSVSIIPQSWKDFEFSEPLIETTSGLDDSAFDGNKTKCWMNLFGCHNPFSTSSINYSRVENSKTDKVWVKSWCGSIPATNRSGVLRSARTCCGFSGMPRRRRAAGWHSRGSGESLFSLYFSQKVFLQQVWFCRVGGAGGWRQERGGRLQ